MDEQACTLASLVEINTARLATLRDEREAALAERDAVTDQLAAHTAGIKAHLDIRSKLVESYYKPNALWGDTTVEVAIQRHSLLSGHTEYLVTTWNLATGEAVTAPASFRDGVDAATQALVAAAMRRAVEAITKAAPEGLALVGRQRELTKRIKALGEDIDRLATFNRGVQR